MKQLVIFKDCWADEFYVEAFTVQEQKEVEKLFSLAQIYFRLFPNQELRISFGTNEALTFEDYETYRLGFEIHNLDETEAHVFQRYFPQFLPHQPSNFGTGSSVFDVDVFYDEFFNLYEKGELPESVIEELKRVEPEFEFWIDDFGK